MIDFESGTFRNELKYICSETQLTLMKGRVSSLLHLDANTGENGVYTIRSLYFDDYDNSSYFEKENGVDIREKFRIRIYNRSTKHIKLEIKRKVHQKTQKIACRLSQEQCRILMAGQPLPNSSDYPPVLQKLCVNMKTRLMKPTVIVEYERTPYIHPDGNVRITFDKHIMSSKRISGFFDKDIPKIPIMAIGQHILEIKYDAYFPGFMRQHLQLDSLRQSTFSKYYICRKNM